MKQTNTAKARKITFNKKATEQIKETVAAAVGLATATTTAAKSAIDMGACIDAKTGANVPIFPLLNMNENAKYSSFKEKHGDRFSRAEWLRGMAFVGLLRAECEGTTAEFKHICGTIKRNCMHWDGTRKSAAAVKRAKKAGLENPDGKQVTKSKAKKSTEKVDALVATRQQIANVITCLNLLKDAQGIAGLPPKADQEKAFELARELQEIFVAE